jgi:hypothetical protein
MACTGYSRIQISVTCVRYDRCSAVMMGKKGLKGPSHKFFSFVSFPSV